MTALLWTAALWLTPSALIVLWLVADSWLDGREDEKRRVEQSREVGSEWLAVLAAVDTPIFAEVWADSLRRDLEEC